MCNRITYVGVVLLLTLSLYSEPRYFISNKDFFVVREIPASTRYAHEYVLELDREDTRETGNLYKYGVIVGIIQRRYDQEGKLLLEERFNRANELIERMRFRYYPDGKPRMAQGEFPDGSKALFIIAERLGGGFNYYQLDENKERIRVQVDESVAIQFRESEKENELAEQQRISRGSDGITRIESADKYGNKRIEHRQNERLILEESYTDGVLTQRKRYTYGSEEKLLALSIERAGTNEKVLYMYQEDRLMREEFYQEDNILRTVDYESNDEKTVTYYRNGAIFIAERFKGEDRIGLEVFSTPIDSP